MSDEAGPGDLDRHALAAVLGGRRIGRRIVVRMAVGSTMDVLADLAGQGAAEGTLVIADHQSAGRGRLDRAWIAPPGAAVLMSMLFRPDLAVDRLGQVPMAVALAALQALDRLLPRGRRAALKWPNDVLVDGRKIAGLLSEAHLTDGRTPAVIVGIGLNVHQRGSDLPVGATSLAAEGVAAPVRAGVAIDIVIGVNGYYDALCAGTSLLPIWSARLDTLGRDVVATGAGATVRGRAVGVDPDGALRIETGAGEFVTVRAGDVTLAESP
jgi:BirA family transcriptional regulator, biotin operon repressor / biotin---[acetyl-CoA-carboxylase] ligase